MKLGVLACLREGKEVTVETGNEKWNFGLDVNQVIEDSLGPFVEGIHLDILGSHFVSDNWDFETSTRERCI